MQEADPKNDDFWIWFFKM